MLFSIALLIFIVVVVTRVSPKESQEDAHIHGAGQIGLLAALALFGVRRPLRFEPLPVAAGDYDHALHSDHPEAPSLLEQYLDHPEPKLGGAPKETAPNEEKLI